MIVLYVSLSWLQTLNKELKELKQHIHTLLEERDSLGSENHDLTKKKAKLELNIKDVEDEMEGNQSMKVRKPLWF